MARPADATPDRRGRDGEHTLLVPFVLSAALLAWSAVGNLALGDTAYVPRNLALTVVLLWGARRSELTWDELGLDPDRWRGGTRLGAVSAGLVVVVVVAGVALRDQVPLVATLLADDRAALSGAGLAYQALLRIPLGTAVFEEVAFRGVLLAVLLRSLPPAAAWAWAAAVFGLWHVPPTIVALRLNDVVPTGGEGLAATAGAVVVTAVAGLGFAWLRSRGKHLTAPVLAHWATNAAGLVAAAATRPG